MTIPQGLFNDVIFLNFKFSANEIELKQKKINVNKKIFLISKIKYII